MTTSTTIMKSNIDRIEKAFDFGRTRARVCGRSISDLEIFNSTAKSVPVDVLTRKDITNFYDDFTVKASPIEMINGKRFVKDSAMTCYDGDLISSDNQKHKIDQMSTFVNLAYYMGKCALANDNREFIIVGNKLSICIPVAEFFAGEDELLKSMLHGNYELYYSVKDWTVLFDIDKENVYVSAEGLVALFPFMNKASWARKLNNKNVLIIDGGKGSLDVAVMKAMQIQRKAAVTSPNAGIGLESTISNALNNAKFSNSLDNVYKSLESGTVNRAGKDIAVGSIVGKAKMSYVSTVHAEVVSSLAMAKMSLQEVDFVFAVGRAFSVGGEFGTDTYTGDLVQMLVDSWGFDTEIIRLEDGDVEIVTEFEDGENMVEVVSKNEVANLRGASMILQAKCK